MSDSTALSTAAADLAAQMVAGELAPEEATRRLHDLWIGAPAGPARDDLLVFGDRVRDWEATEWAHRQIQDVVRFLMLADAHELLAGSGVRRRDSA